MGAVDSCGNQGLKKARAGHCFWGTEILSPRITNEVATILTSI